MRELTLHESVRGGGARKGLVYDTIVEVNDYLDFPLPDLAALETRG